MLYKVVELFDTLNFLVIVAQVSDVVPGPLVQRFYVDAITYNKCMKIHFLIIVLRINNISKAF